MCYGHKSVSRKTSNNHRNRFDSTVFWKGEWEVAIGHKKSRGINLPEVNKVNSPVQMQMMDPEKSSMVVKREDAKTKKVLGNCRNPISAQPVIQKGQISGTFKATSIERRLNRAAKRLMEFG